jgi:hypothetical protein
MEETIVEEPRYLDGPKLVEWLTKDEGVKFERLTDAQKRRWRDWEAGERADLYGAVDRILTSQGISMRLIPDDCWSRDQRKERKARLSREEMQALRREALVLIKEGHDNKHIAQRLDVNNTTVGKWRKKFAA